MEKQTYEKPSVVEIGSAADLTQGGSVSMVVDAEGMDNLGIPTS